MTSDHTEHFNEQLLLAIMYIYYVKRKAVDHEIHLLSVGLTKAS